MKELSIAAVRKIFAGYLKKAGYKENTGRQKERKIEIFFLYLNDIEKIHDIRDADENMVKRFLVFLNEKVSDRTGRLMAANTKRELFSIARLLFNCLYVEELILINPMRNVLYRPKGAEKKREILTLEEMNRFLDGIDESKRCGERDKAMFELMYSSGLRAGDIGKLNTCDVDFESRMVLLKEGKFSKDRVVPISKVAQVFLKQYLAERKSNTPILFPGLAGSRLKTGAVNTRCKKWMKESGVYRKGLCAHSIRHSTAVHLLLNGADLRYVQELLGHESIETTVTYTHDLDENVRKVYKTYHPRENMYFKEVDDDYLKRLRKFKEELTACKEITRRQRKTAKKFYAKNRERILKNTKQWYNNRKKLTK
jgi:site-specific recombinase XerD